MQTPKDSLAGILVEWFKCRVGHPPSEELLGHMLHHVVLDGHCIMLQRIAADGHPRTHHLCPRPDLSLPLVGIND